MQLRAQSPFPVLFLAAGVLLAVAYGLAPNDVTAEVIEVGVGLAAVAAGIVAMVVYQPFHRTAWVAQTVGVGLLTAATVAAWWQREAEIDQFPSVDDALLLAGLLMLSGSLLLRLRESIAVHDPFGRLDTALVCVAVALLGWLALIEPLLTAPELTALERSVSVAHPIAGVIVLTALARFLFGTASRTATATLTSGGLVAVAGSLVTLQLLDGVGAPHSRGPAHIVAILALALLGAAALDPSMAERVSPPATSAQLQPSRVAILVISALTPPVTLLIGAAALTDPDPMFLVVAAGATVVSFMLALVRMSLLVGSVQTTTVKAGEDRFEALVEYSTDVIAVVDREGMIRYVSPAFRTALGRDPEAHANTALRRIAHPDDVATLTTHLFQAASRPRHSTSRFETRLLATDGTVREFEVVAANLVGDDVVDGLALTMRDISDRKALAAELSHQAFHDSLTGLANRALFADRVDHALHRRRRDPDCTIAVLFVDLDDFKAVNDGLGHGAGDALLRAVGQRIVRCLRAGDTAARLGGDEFAVLLEDDSFPGQATTIAARILEALRVPVSVGDMELGVVASIGVTVAKEDSSTVGLLRDADIAMYEAKRAGKGRVCVFDPSMRDSASDRLALQTDLGNALENKQLRVVFQPIVDLTSGYVGGAEALVRWRHPERGEIPPGAFIPVAEQTGLVVPIGEWVMIEACAQAARCGGTVGVNVSGVQFSAPGFLDSVSLALIEAGLPPSRLTVEITETALMADTDATARLLDQLRELGVRIAIDDFGTGYCSLAYLQRFAVDIVKIDRAFIAELDGESKGDRLAKTIMQMAESLDVTTVVAEGIETEEQLNRLLEMGCVKGQGFLLSPPLERPAYERLLADHLPEDARPITTTATPTAAQPAAAVTGAGDRRPEDLGLFDRAPTMEIPDSLPVDSDLFGTSR